jgi:Putative F0F1-ATPase subunit Ca2+/Mg2+ transporter
VDPGDRREIYNGFGDSLARAVELTVTPGVFGFLGWLLDGRLSTTPLFTVLFTVLVFAYVAWRLWTGYEATMRAHEERLGLHARRPQRRPDG